MLSRHTVLQDQTLEDIAVVKYGSVEGVSKILDDNPTLSWDTELISGSVVLIEKEFYTNKEMAFFLNEKGAAPASAFTEVEVDDDPGNLGDFNSDFNSDFS